MYFLKILKDSPFSFVILDNDRPCPPVPFRDDAVSPPIAEGVEVVGAGPQREERDAVRAQRTHRGGLCEDGDLPLPAPLPQMEAFRDRLTRGGITATIRASRGEDIFAACGLLAGKHKEL